MSFKFVPTACPTCGSKLEWKNHDLYCMNLICPGKAYENLYHWVKIIGQRDILGVGNSLITSIISYYNWYNISDIYEKNPPTEDNCRGMLSADGIGEAKLKVIRHIIRYLTKVPTSLTGFLVGMNLKGISYNIAHDLEFQTNLEDCIKNNTPQKMNVTQVKGLGEAVLQTLTENWENITNLYRLTEKLHIQKNSAPIKAAVEPAKEKLKVCITGKANNGLTRSQFYKKFENSIIESTVNSCDYLVCNVPSNSSKIKMAKAKGIKVITEDELQEIVGSDRYVE